jgi:hypothetical protein
LIPAALLGCKKDCESVTLADIKKADPDGYEELKLEGRYLAMSPEARGMPGNTGSG